MSFTSWLIRFLDFREFSDSICLTREGLNLEIRKLALERAAQGEIVFVISQFRSTFLVIQDLFEAVDVPYTIVTDPIDQGSLQKMVLQKGATRIVLTLACMLPQTPLTQLQYARHLKISIMIAEHHPLAKFDQSIRQSARQFPFPTSIGFFLALDDPILKPMNSDWVGHLLRQMGAGERDLISSQMVSKRVRSLQRRYLKNESLQTTDESPELWLELNTPQ